MRPAPSIDAMQARWMWLLLSGQGTAGSQTSYVGQVGGLAAGGQAEAALPPPNQCLALTPAEQLPFFHSSCGCGKAPPPNLSPTYSVLEACRVN